MSGESWVEKHRPETFGEIQGNNKDVKALKDWVDGFTPGDQAQLLVGPPGVGKTTVAYVLSKHFDYPLHQINASSARGSEGIEDIADSIGSSPIDSEYQIVLVDEVDSQHHSTNKRPLYDALDEPKNPVILTANEEYDVPQTIRNKANKRDFKLGKRSRKAKLKKIAKEEGLDLPKADLKDLAERPGLRSAIHDLQLWAEQDIPPGSDDREWELSEFDVVDKVLHGKMESGHMTPPDLVMWLDENLSREFRGVEAAVAYDTLARADKWLRRAQKEDYRYWKYAGELAEQTATQRISEPYDGYLKKDFPEWFRHSKPKTKGKTPEASLFRALKGIEVIRDSNGNRRISNSKAGFGMTGSFLHFRNQILPILKKLPVEERLELAKTHRLDKKALKALDLTTKQFEDWANQEVPDERHQTEDELMQEDALSW